MKRRPFLWFAVSLTVLLAFLFRRSFIANEVVFSNDGPFGLMSAFSDLRWDSFFNGSWLVLNWVGSVAPGLTAAFQHAIFLVGGPVFFSKFVAPLSLLALGCAAWLFGRRMGFHPWVCALLGLAAALNSNVFSYVCWGLPSRASTLAAVFLAFAALAGRGHGRDWLWVALAGFAVGQVVVEGADVGAIFSLVVAAYLAFQALVASGSKGRNLALGAGRIAVVALCAGWLATHSLVTLIGSQVKGVAVLKDYPKSAAERWDFITGWSFPKVETIRVLIPGLFFGYRMDTPDGGAYWGTVGADGTPAGRFNGAGEYAGVLVVLIAAWAVARSLSRKPGAFTDDERPFLWFWAGVALVSLLLSFGRFALFFEVAYQLPFLSTIRIPAKYLHVFHLSLLMLFAFGLQGLWRQYLEKAAARKNRLGEHLRAWWNSVAGGERRWAIGLGAFTVLSVFGVVIYTASRRELERHLGVAGFPGADGQAVAGFSVREAWLYLVFLFAGAAMLILIVAGWFSGTRAGRAFGVLAALLVLDLLRASTPWVRHYDWRWRYQSNPVVDFLKEHPHEQRMTARLLPLARQMFVSPDDGYFTAVHNLWLEHHFQFNHIQTLDIIQAPRLPEMDRIFIETFAPASATNLQPAARLWELTGTRWVLGARAFEGQLNSLLDPQKKRLSTKLNFDLTPKPGASEARINEPDSHTAIANPNGRYSIFEFAGALPRAKLYSQWEVNTNDTATLQRLVSPAFDPGASVVVAEPINPSTPSATPPPASATITSYVPKRIQIATKSPRAGVLLLNERWHPTWEVTVDGQPAPLLRCNFLMRGVEVPAGEHQVEFHCRPPMGTLYASFSGLAAAIVLCGFVTRRSPAASPAASPAPASAPEPKQPTARPRK